VSGTIIARHGELRSVWLMIFAMFRPCVAMILMHLISSKNAKRPFILV
jgi:hypothetical protein